MYRQVTVAGIYFLNIQAQVCVVVSIIRCFNKCACDEHVIVTVIVVSDVEGVKFWNGELIPSRAEKEGKEKNKSKRMKVKRRMCCPETCKGRQETYEQSENQE